MKSQVRRICLVMLACLSALVLIAMGGEGLMGPRAPFLVGGFSPASAYAQPTPLRRINPATLSAQVYEQLPDFPLENQYISSESGEAAIENTLVSRIIRYHLYSQERPTNFRLDWKLTMADYLGAFERITPDQYPDYGLRENPMAGDIAVVQSLTPAMRDRLVNTLYETFTPDSATAESTTSEPAISEPAAVEPATSAPSTADDLL